MARAEANPMEDGRAMHGVWMGSIRGWLRAVPGVALVLVLTCVPAGRSQSGSGGGQNSVRPPFSTRQDIGTMTSDDYDPMMTERRLRALNAERQKEMVADANKLLKLARELNAQVAMQKPESLTPEQLHKIAEIEKLARNVRQRMSAAVGEPQTEFPSPTVVYPAH